MKTKITDSNIIKWIILYVLSVGAGTFVMNNILGRIDVNVWFARGGGVVATAITALVLYKLMFSRLGRGVS